MQHWEMLKALSDLFDKDIETIERFQINLHSLCYITCKVRIGTAGYCLIFQTYQAMNDDIEAIYYASTFDEILAIIIKNFNEIKGKYATPQA